MPVELLTTMTPEQIEARLLELLASHNNDPDAHGLAAQIAALTASLNTLSNRYRYAAFSDSFDRADGAAAGASTALVPGTSAAWRNALATTTAVVSGNTLKSSTGAASVIMTDLAGHQTSGVTTVTMMGTIGNGDVYIYAAFSEGTPSGVVLQRGSDRIRVGTQVGGALTWAQEYLIGSPGRAERITLRLDATANTATVLLDGTTVINGVALANNTRGASIGVRLSGTTAVIDNVLALREVTL